MRLSRVCPSPDSSPDGFGRGAAHAVDAVAVPVLLIIQKPAGVHQPADVDRPVTQTRQQLRHAVHVQEDTGPTGTVGRAEDTTNADTQHCYRDSSRKHED